MGPKLAYVVRHHRNLLFALKLVSVMAAAAVRMLDVPEEQLRLFGPIEDHNDS